MLEGFTGRSDSGSSSSKIPNVYPSVGDFLKIILFDTHSSCSQCWHHWRSWITNHWSCIRGSRVEKRWNTCYNQRRGPHNSWWKATVVQKSVWATGGIFFAPCGTITSRGSRTGTTIRTIPTSRQAATQHKSGFPSSTSLQALTKRFERRSQILLQSSPTECWRLRGQELNRMTRTHASSPNYHRLPWACVR